MGDMMRRFIIFFLSLLCLIALTSCDLILYEGFVIDKNSNNFEITTDGELIKYNGNSSIVEIPDNVRVIKRDAFKDLNNLYGVIVPKDLYRIEDNAFNNCKKLVEIYNYSKLEIVEQSETNGNIAKYALIVHEKEEKNIIQEVAGGYISFFKDDEEYLIDYIGTRSDIIIPLRFTMINKYAFYESSIKTVVFSSLVKEVLPYAFAECKDLSSIVFNTSLKDIGNNAFQNCVSLTSITVPKRLSLIEDNAFNGCMRLTEIINLNDSLNLEMGSESHGMIAYYAKSILLDLDEPHFLKKNGDFITYESDGKVRLLAYQGSDYFVKVPEEIEILDDLAFLTNNNAVSITLGKNIVEIGSALSPFYHLMEIYNLSNIDQNSFASYDLDYYDSKNVSSKLSLQNGSIIRTDGDDIKLIVAGSKTGTYNIMEGITSLDDYAFYDDDIDTLVIYFDVPKMNDNAILNSNIKQVYVNGTELDFILDESMGIMVYYYSEVYKAGSWHYVGNQIEVWQQKQTQDDESSLSTR